MASQTNPYAAAHAEPQGEGDARPIAMQIIEDEGLAGKLTGKVMLITGSSSGIGIETVRALYATGADIYMQVRDVEKGGKVLQEVKSATRGTGKLELLKIDLAELQSVRDGVGEFLKREKHLNVLVNNAGRFFLSWIATGFFSFFRLLRSVLHYCYCCIPVLLYERVWWPETEVSLG